MFKFFSALAMIALCVSAEAQAQIGKPVKILAQSQNGEFTLRVLKAKWATNKEISQWSGSERALALWVDVTSTAPFVPSEEDKKGDRLSLVSRLIDGELVEDGHHSQIATVGADRYGRETPYIPGKSPQGQMIWQVRGVDPRTKEVLLEWELLTPSSSIVRAEWPAALLTKDHADQKISKNDKAETRRFLIRFPLNQAEAPTPPMPMPITLKTVTVGGNSWQVWSAKATKSSSKVTSLFGATNGLSSPDVESWRMSIPVILKGEGSRKNWIFDLRDESGHEWPAGSSVQYDRSSIKYWRPDGTLIGANEMVLELPTQFAPQLKPEGKWTLEGRRETDGQQYLDGEFSAIELFQATGTPTTGYKGAWTLRAIRRFSADSPLPPEWAPTGQGAGVAVQLALSVPQKEAGVRAMLSEVMLSDGTALKPYDDNLMVVGRETTPTGAVVVFQGILPPVENIGSTLSFKVNGRVSKAEEPMVAIGGLSFETTKPKMAQ